MLKALIISGVIFLSGSNQKDFVFQQKNCNGLSLSANKTNQDNGITVEVIVSGGVKPYTYIFYKESGQLLSTDFNSNSVRQLSRGKYFCTVADKNSCKKTIEIEIQ